MPEERGSDSALDALKELLESRIKALKDYFEQRLIDMQRAVDAALAAQKDQTKGSFDASEKAIGKAEAASEKRFDSVNEFRGQLKDQQATFLPRIEADGRFKEIINLIAVHSQQISEVQKTLSRGEGGAAATLGQRLQQNWNVGTIIAVLGLIAALIYFLVGKN